MKSRTIEPPLRLGLAFFGEDDERFVRALVVSMASDALPWVVADEAPVHALLLARGLRRRDGEDAAILLLGTEAARKPRACTATRCRRSRCASRCARRI